MNEKNNEELLYKECNFSHIDTVQYTYVHTWHEYKKRIHSGQILVELGNTVYIHTYIQRTMKSHSQNSVCDDEGVLHLAVLEDALLLAHIRGIRNIVQVHVLICRQGGLLPCSQVGDVRGSVQAGSILGVVHTGAVVVFVADNFFHSGQARQGTFVH